MASKKKNIGKVVGRSNGYYIRQINSTEGDGKTLRVTGSSIGIYKGKKLVEGNFNSKEKAIEKAMSLSSTSK